jgi:hypothetical protein
LCCQWDKDRIGNRPAAVTLEKLNIGEGFKKPTIILTKKIFKIRVWNWDFNHFCQFSIDIDWITCTAFTLTTIIIGMRCQGLIPLDLRMEIGRKESLSVILRKHAQVWVGTLLHSGSRS